MDTFGTCQLLLMKEFLCSSYGAVEVHQTKKSCEPLSYNLICTLCGAAASDNCTHCCMSYLQLTILHKARSVRKCVSHQQLAAPRSVSTVDVSLQTAASVREAGEATTVPAVWISLFPSLTDISSLSLSFAFPPIAFPLSSSLQVHTQINFTYTTGNDNWPLVKWPIFTYTAPSHTEGLSNGNGKGALPHAQQWVIDVSLSPETSLLDRRDAELHLHLSLTVTKLIKKNNSSNFDNKVECCKVKGIKQSTLISETSDKVLQKHVTKYVVWEQ